VRSRTATWVWATVALLLVIQAAEIFNVVRRESLTFDEDNHIFAGFMMWMTGDYGLNPEHPPLVKLLATSVILGEDLKVPALQGRFFKSEAYMGGRDFLWANDPDHHLMLRMRLAAGALALAMSLTIFLAALEWFGPAAGLIAMTIAVFDPNLLAHSALVTTDMALSCFVLLTLLAFYRWASGPTSSRLVLAGLAAGLTIGSKHSGILLAPMLIALAIFECIRAKRGHRLRTIGRMLGGLTAIVLIAVFVLWSLYGFRYAARPDGMALSPSLAQYMAPLSRIDQRVVAACARWHLLPESYLMGLVDVQLVAQGSPTFIMGKVYAHGVWWYFPTAILIKTTLALMGLVALAGYAIATGKLKRVPQIVLRPLAYQPITSQPPTPIGRRNRRMYGSGGFGQPEIEDSETADVEAETGAAKRAGVYTDVAFREVAYIVLPCLIYLLVAMTSGLNIGARHVLPLYALAAVLAGGGAWALIRSNQRWAYVIAVLVAWHIGSALLAYPNDIAYANEAWGGPKQVHRYLSDANADWAQQLVQVKQWQDRHPNDECWFAYFARPVIDPAMWGIRCHALPTFDTQWMGDNELVPPQIHGAVLISAGDLSGCEWQSGQLNPYLRFQAMKPEEQIDYGVMVYRGDVALPEASALSLAFTADALRHRGKLREALATAQRAAKTQPDGLIALTSLGDAEAAVGDKPAARNAYEKAIVVAQKLEPDAQSDYLPGLKAKVGKL
jgi:4-amino-4-deoxy-L-arabinose transferase-like glycosyltransferase